MTLDIAANARTREPSCAISKRFTRRSVMSRETIISGN